ncbi:hypothetical protein K2Q16_02630 [Patescibacteria group bacterium]|nr:hypothetical protein [Patescibacteria group bacterium]
MAEKPAKKSSPARAPRVVGKKASSKEVIPSVQRKPRSTKVTPAKKKSDDELRQEVAQRVVRKIFDEIGLPEAVHVRVAAKPATQPRAKVFTTVAETVTLATHDTEVMLPSNASARVLAKAAALQQWYRSRFPDYVAKGATRLGIVFLLCGGLGMAQFTFTYFPTWHTVQTALLCGAVECANSTLLPTTPAIGTPDSPVINTAGVPTILTIPAPAVSFIAKPPAIIESPERLVVRAEYISSLEVIAQSRVTNKSVVLARSGEPVGPDYSYELQPTNFDPGEYDVRAKAVAARDGSQILVTGPRFTIPTRTTLSSTISISETEDGNEPALESISLRTTTDASAPIASSTSTMAPINAEPQVVTAPLQGLALSLSRPESGVVLLSLLSPDALSVELFAQRSNATAPYFLASARKLEEGRWIHRLSLSSLPVGNYFITARVKTPAGMFTSRGVVIEVSAPSLPPVATTTAVRPATTNTAETITELKESAIPPPPRTAYFAPAITPGLIEVPGSSQVSSGTVPSVAQAEIIPARPVETAVMNPLIESIFESQEDSLNDLLMRYASAFQSGDSALQALINEELERTRSVMVETAIIEGESSVTATELDATIADEFGRLKERVETFESLLRDRSGNSAAVDTDQDGLSDFDEETLYDTDPLRSDSDSDGVSDGAEIMRGFNPLDSVAEALLAFTSPKEFGIVRDDVLRIETVTPIIESDETRGQPDIQAEIRGVALPNSYVTLFIYSTPVMVTLRTAADGSFVYQFDKELEDGAHEIFVAVTDNTGDIIAKSAPFSFVKQAEAFTVTDADATTVASTEGIITPSVKDLYNMVLAMGVLAFGLILLIIGMAMRRNSVVTGAQTATTGSA